jgi:hypothetical protein
MTLEYRVEEGGGAWVPQGQPAPPARPALRVKAITRVVALGGEFAGGEVTVRRNVPMATILRLDKLRADGELDQLLDIVPEIVLGWNFEDEDGTPIPVTPDGVRQLPVDLFRAVMDAFGALVTEGAAVSPN